MPTLNERWERIRPEVTLRDLALDVTGKLLFGIGVGALLASALQPVAWVLVALGLGLSLAVKSKHAKRFWS